MLLRERSGPWAAADAESRASELEGIQYDRAVSALRGSVQYESAEPLFPVRWRWQWQRALVCTVLHTATRHRAVSSAVSSAVLPQQLAALCLAMGLFPRARGATPSEPNVVATEEADDAGWLEPEPEPEVHIQAIRADGGKQRKKKKAGEYAGTGEVVKKGKNKGKDRVSREHMLLSRLEKQGDNYKNDGETLIELAALYADKHAWAQAIHYYKLSLRALPESREAIIPGLANAYFEYDLFEEAQFLYQDAVKKPAHVRMPKVWYHLGVIYERQQKWEIAEYCLRHSLTLLPPLRRDVEIHCRLATCSNRLGKSKDAIQSFKSACTAAANPEIGAQPWISEEMVWFELALQYDATSEPQLAKRCYGKSLMNATSAESWQALGKRYSEIKEGTRAVSALNKAVELDSENPLLWWSLAEAYCCLHEKEKCIDGIRKVGIKLEKLVADVKRREDEMRKQKLAAEEQARLASTSVHQVNAGQADLKAQLAQAQGALSQAGSASADLARKLSEWEVEKQVYQKREMVWEQRERDYKARLEEQEKQWRAKVDAALQDMSAHPALASVQRENERLKQEVGALQMELSSMQMLNGGGGGADRHANTPHHSMVGKMAARQAGV